MEIGTAEPPPPEAIDTWAQQSGHRLDDGLGREPVPDLGTRARRDAFASEIVAACEAPRWRTSLSVPFTAPEEAVELGARAGAVHGDGARGRGVRPAGAGAAVAARARAVADSAACEELTSLVSARVAGRRGALGARAVRADGRHRPAAAGGAAAELRPLRALRARVRTRDASRVSSSPRIVNTTPGSGRPDGRVSAATGSTSRSAGSGRCSCPSTCADSTSNGSSSCSPPPRGPRRLLRRRAGRPRLPGRRGRSRSMTRLTHRDRDVRHQHPRLARAAAGADVAELVRRALSRARRRAPARSRTTMGVAACSCGCPTNRARRRNWATGRCPPRTHLSVSAEVHANPRRLDQIQPAGARRRSRKDPAAATARRDICRHPTLDRLLLGIW